MRHESVSRASMYKSHPARTSAVIDSRARSPEGGKLTAETRELFESASAELLRVARDFERTGHRTAGLANNGSTFVTACIQTCGIQPTTYRAPYSRRGEGRAWA